MASNPVESRYSPKYSSSHALLVGIDRYYHPKIPTLNSAESEAKALSEILKKSPYKFQVKELIGPKATRDSILRELNQLRDSQPDDRLLIYFAGHGYTVSDRFNNDTGYILAYDSSPENDFTMIPLDEIVKLRLYASSKHIGFIFDTCFSGSVLGLTRMPQIAAEKFLTRRAFQVISAGAADQTVSDYKSMTSTILQVLHDQPISLPGLPTFSALGHFLQQSIANDTKKTQIPQYGHLTGSQGGDILLYAQLESDLNSEKPKESNVKRTKKTSNISTKGIRIAEVDLVGRLDNHNLPTVLSISAGLSYTVWISPEEKQLFSKRLRQNHPNWNSTRIYVYTYSIILVLLLFPHIMKLDEIIIDQEYQGYEPLIKNTVLTILRNQGKKIEKTKIQIKKIDRPSQASRTASLVYKGLSEPDQIITEQELINIVEEKMRSGPLSK
jgi:hypothetical protein